MKMWQILRRHASEEHEGGINKGAGSTPLGEEDGLCLVSVIKEEAAVLDICAVKRQLGDIIISCQSSYGALHSLF
jgi:hypothetical protein